ncbi:hypothetical protein [Roseiterribacter gracilis]|uniref:Uncharacterized protein n=1 Tax=Roseiterribacter gracilis TaxID=2812848 RepID=A0A8S8XCM4_9PROT|nr:hypothetical protein TMPK1_26710 [Rhodospirillales bacterium TMPK1]
MRIESYVLAAALLAMVPTTSFAQGQPRPQSNGPAKLEDVLLAACIQGAKYSSDNPRQVDYVTGKAQATTHGIVNNPRFKDVISVVATMKVGDARRNVRCDFGRATPKDPIDFLAAQWDGRTYVGEPNQALRPRMKEPDDVKREDRFLGAVYEMMRNASGNVR